MSNELVSIIVPVYNVEAYIEECLQSIVSQTYDNLEIILIDDGSTDNSSRICKDFSQKDFRIRYFRKPNGGLSDARNFGIARASGEFIFFVDSDDWIIDKTVETLISIQKKYKSKIVIATYNQLIESEGIYYFRALDEHYYEQVYTRKEFFEELPELEKRDPAFVTSWGTLWHRSLFDNISFPVGKICEDLGTSYQLYLQCEKIVFVNVALYWYRIRGNSIWTSTASNKFVKDDCDLRLERLAILGLKGINTMRYKQQMISVVKNEWYPRLENSKCEDSPLKKRVDKILFLLENESNTAD